MFFCEFCESCKNTFFAEHIQATAFCYTKNMLWGLIVVKVVVFWFVIIQTRPWHGYVFGRFPILFQICCFYYTSLIGLFSYFFFSFCKVVRFIFLIKSNLNNLAYIFLKDEMVKKSHFIDFLFVIFWLCNTRFRY